MLKAITKRINGHTTRIMIRKGRIIELHEDRGVPGVVRVVRLPRAA